MVVLFDQEKAMEIHDYNVRKEAREGGRLEGMEKGISAMVTTLKELSIEKNSVAQTLIQQFNLSPQVAAAKVEQYWGR